MTDRYVLGLSAYYHDSAACLLRNGEIVAAAQEERFTRKKGDANFPHNAVAFCLEQAGIRVEDLDAVGFYDKPLLKFERILETYLGVAPRGFASFLMAGPLWIKEKLYIDEQLKRRSPATRARFSTQSITNRTRRARSCPRPSRKRPS